MCLICSQICLVLPLKQSLRPAPGFDNHLNWLKSNPKYFMQNYKYFRYVYQAEYTAYLRVYINTSFIC